VFACVAEGGGSKICGVDASFFGCKPSELQELYKEILPVSFVMNHVGGVIENDLHLRLRGLFYLSICSRILRKELHFTSMSGGVLHYWQSLSIHKYKFNVSWVSGIVIDGKVSCTYS
jgi:hypothetical protein